MNKKSKKSAKKITNDDRTKCEVYSRVVGYLRPVNQWNDGKSSEYSDRKEYQV
jgi:anaerobic ribonucleoside-triphosphate reductase